MTNAIGHGGHHAKSGNDTAGDFYTTARLQRDQKLKEVKQLQHELAAMHRTKDNLKKEIDDLLLEAKSVESHSSASSNTPDH